MEFNIKSGLIEIEDILTRTTGPYFANISGPKICCVPRIWTMFHGMVLSFIQNGPGTLDMGPVNAVNKRMQHRRNNSISATKNNNVRFDAIF